MWEVNKSLFYQMKRARDDGGDDTEEGVWATVIGDVLCLLATLNPHALPSLFRVSRYYHRVLMDGPPVMWEAYFRFYCTTHPGYSEHAPGQEVTMPSWREVVRRRPAKLRPRPFLLIEWPLMSCGALWPRGSQWNVCRACDKPRAEHGQSLVERCEMKMYIDSFAPVMYWPHDHVHHVDTSRMKMIRFEEPLAFVGFWCDQHAWWRALHYLDPVRECIWREDVPYPVAVREPSPVDKEPTTVVFVGIF